MPMHLIIDATEAVEVEGEVIGGTKLNRGNLFGCSIIRDYLLLRLAKLSPALEILNL
jgi:hypothetical protein